jgi:RNA polymerase sigma-70 factor (ECF subfamily)
MPADPEEPLPPDGLFRTTHWSVVLAAQEEDSTGASRAMEVLCRAYWYPLYAFVRRRGYDTADAQDLTQEFFYRLLQKDFLRNVAREKGKFRTFLLASLKNFLVSEWHRGQAAKRGGGRGIVSLDEMQAEDRYANEPAAQGTPEELYDQKWALTTMEQAMDELQEEFRASGKFEHFNRFKPFLSARGDDAEYERAGTSLGLNAGAFAVAVHRFRRRYAQVLRTVVSQTVSGPDQIEEELRFLAQALQ